MEDTLKECSILYCQKDLPMTETCMCWGWEHGQGWDEIVRQASCELEVLNRMWYPKYKVRIQADQIKEKFGELTWYWSVACDNYSFIGKFGIKLNNLMRWLMRHINFRPTTIIDAKEYTTDEVEEINKDRYNNLKKYKDTANTVFEKDGKYFRNYKLYHCQQSHIEFMRFKHLRKMIDAISRFSFIIKSFGTKDPSDMQKILITYLDSKAEEIINNATKKCTNVCEDCGHQIGTNWSPKCETTGWITYICKDCAEKSGKRYYKNNELWDGKKRVMTKKEVESHKKAINKKIKDSIK